MATMSSEVGGGVAGWLASQPWANTNGDDTYAPDARTLRFLRGEPPLEGDWPSESPEAAPPPRS